MREGESTMFKERLGEITNSGASVASAILASTAFEHRVRLRQHHLPARNLA